MSYEVKHLSTHIFRQTFAKGKDCNFEQLSVGLFLTFVTKKLVRMTDDAASDSTVADNSHKVKYIEDMEAELQH